MEDTITTTDIPIDSGVPLLERARQVVSRLQELAPHYDQSRSFPVGSFDAIRNAGLLAAPLPAEQGGVARHGSPESRQRLLQILKTVGRGDLSVGRLYEGHVNALQLIQIFGTPAQVEAWSREARDEHLLFAVWNTEAGDGVKLERLSNGRIRMTGSKTFASGAGNIQRPIVPGALPDGGWQMCVVPMDDVEVTIDDSWWQPPGMHASTSYKVDFTGVELEPEMLLGQPDDYHRQPWFFGGAVRFAAVHLGGAEALLDATRSFLRKLDRTGDPHQRARIGEAAILVESGNLWLDGAARHVNLDPDAIDAGGAINYAHMTRLAIEQICLDVMRITERAVGARGMLRPEPMERVIRDLTLYLRQPAPDFAQMSVGAHLLDSDTDADRIWASER